MGSGKNKVVNLIQNFVLIQTVQACRTSQGCIIILLKSLLCEYTRWIYCPTIPGNLYDG